MGDGGGGMGRAARFGTLVRVCGLAASDMALHNLLEVLGSSQFVGSTWLFTICWKRKTWKKTWEKNVEKKNVGKNVGKKRGKKNVVYQWRT
jgi:hypothetical protein